MGNSGGRWALCFVYIVRICVLLSLFMMSNTQFQYCSHANMSTGLVIQTKQAMHNACSKLERVTNNGGKVGTPNRKRKDLFTLIFWLART